MFKLGQGIELSDAWKHCLGVHLAFVVCTLLLTC